MSVSQTTALDLAAIQQRLDAPGHYHGRGDVVDLLAALRETRAALRAMMDMMDKVWPSVSWGKTFNLPIQEMNEAPGLAARALKSVVDGVEAL